MTKRQLICFGSAALIGVPSYLFTRGAIGNTASVLLMMAVMAPLFLLAMYEKDGLPAEKIIRNYVRTKFYFAGIRPYRTANFYDGITKQGSIGSPPAKCRNTGGGTDGGNIGSSKQREVGAFDKNREEPAKAAKPKHPGGKGKPGGVQERR